MNITEVHIKLVDQPGDKLRAFASITIDDCLVVRDLKVIEGPKGLFVAMPSRKAMERCPRCAFKNPARSRYCNDCGGRLDPKRDVERPADDARALDRLYTDIAHPIHQHGRDLIQRLVVEAYRREREQAQPAGDTASERADWHEEAWE